MLFNGHGYIADPSFIKGCFESGSGYIAGAIVILISGRGGVQ
jgi:hypothetical protein